METITPPLGMVILFVLALLLVVGAVLTIFVLPGTEFGKRMPGWMVPVAYTVVMLGTPVVLLFLGMVAFPCWWQKCP